MPMCQQTERRGNIVPDWGRWEHRACSCPGLRHGSAQGRSLTLDLPLLQATTSMMGTGGFLHQEMVPTFTV